jgi:hypothetical protein
MRDSWYYAVPEGQIGPITLQELKETLPTLPNAKDVYIWHDSLPDWIRAGDLADIVANAKSVSVAQPQYAHADAREAVATEPSATEADWEPQPAEEADWNPESLGDLHPDPSVAINAPSIVTAGPAAAEEPEVAVEDVKTPRAWRTFFVGVLVMLLACAIVYAGITGRAAWSGLVLHRANRLIDAAPGLVLLLVGLFVAWGSLRRPAS